MTNKKILILTYYWPPAGGPGVQRWLKFVKYMPQNGIEPIVLTVDPAFAEYPQKDESLMQDIALDLKVYKTKCRSVYDLYKKFTHSKTAPYGGFANEAYPTLKQKISRFVRGNFFLPDPRRGWNKYAYREAIRLIREFQIDTVVTTGPPHSTHLVGLKLKRKIQHLKWISDFRDPWTDLYFYNLLYPTPIAKAVDRLYERNVLINADIVITISKHVKQQLAAKSPLIHAEKIRVIPNGYDESDFLETIEKEKTFTITYAGTMATGYSVDVFFQVLKNIHNEIPYKIRFIGKIDERIRQNIPDDINEHFEFIPYQPHKQAVKFLQTSSVLLLVIPDIRDNQGILTGKLFEYIGSDTPIICLGPINGNAAEIIAECQAGQTFEPIDHSGIENYIRDCYYNFINHHHNSHKTMAYRFSRKALTQELCKLI